MPAWDTNWDQVEVENEETRRLCWSALMLVASHTSACVAHDRKPLELFLTDSSNVCVLLPHCSASTFDSHFRSVLTRNLSQFHLLFPGEYLQRSSLTTPHSGKDTVWALYCRSMLLWNSCTHFQDENLTGDEKAKIAIAVYTETRAVEQALDAHICNLDTALIYMCREFIAKYVLPSPSSSITS